jgi:signal peptidase II
MASTVSKRWQILITIGLIVAGVDQWTKFLAVKHLTPGIARTGTDETGPLSKDKQVEILSGMSAGAQFVAFATVVKGPCDSYIDRCPTVEVTEGFWNWRYVQNPGAAWGLFAKADDSVRVPFFLAVSLAAMIFIMSFVRKLEEEQMLLLISLSLVFGGALGNFIDRLHLNYVIDFIDWYVGTSHWPTFNVADAAISGGVALLVVEWIRDAIRARNGSASEAPSK